MAYYQHSEEALGVSPSGEEANKLNCKIVENEFEPKSRYHLHFRTNTLGKGMKSLILPVMR